MEPPLGWQDPRGEAVEESRKLHAHPEHLPSPQHHRLGPCSLRRVLVDPMTDPFTLPVSLGLRTGLIHALHSARSLS